MVPYSGKLIYLQNNPMHIYSEVCLLHSMGLTLKKLLIGFSLDYLKAMSLTCLQEIISVDVKKVYVEINESELEVCMLAIQWSCLCEICGIFKSFL